MVLQVAVSSPTAMGKGSSHHHHPPSLCETYLKISVSVDWLVFSGSRGDFRNHFGVFPYCPHIHVLLQLGFCIFVRQCCLCLPAWCNSPKQTLVHRHSSSLELDPGPLGAAHCTGLCFAGGRGCVGAP